MPLGRARVERTDSLAPQNLHDPFVYKSLHTDDFTDWSLWQEKQPPPKCPLVFGFNASLT